jgi:hypothetical protein
MWEEESGRHRGGIENVHVRVWEGDKGRHGGGIKLFVRECGSRDRGTQRGR